jgi:TPP-dependent pyruvate/acetoin dehydrogenase alpha subunit
LRATDHVFSNHRCHGHFLARTGDAYGLLAELLGRPDGVSGGIGGSQHLCAPGFKANGVLGGTVPAAAGIALAKAISGTDDLSVAFMGDGALGEGVVYETFNIAALWRLPILFVLEDNGWSQSTPAALNRSGDVVSRFKAFEIPVERLESTDVVEIHRLAGGMIDAMRSEGGPAALVIDTYRLCHHSKSDDNRPEDEVLSRWEFEPLRVQATRLEDDDRLRVEREVEAALNEVFGQALAR